MELNLLVVESDKIGYGRLGVELTKAVQSLGVDIYNHLPTDTREHILAGENPSKICNTVCWVSTPTHARGWYENQIPSMFTMYETTHVPESFRAGIRVFDTLIVPSIQNQEMFSQYHPNVKYVPLAIDPERWHYVPRTPPAPFFNFLCCGSGSRKGVDLAVKAYKKLFKDESTWKGRIPRLILKNPRGDMWLGKGIEVIGGRIDNAAEDAIYAKAHCMISASRGEGFGLQPLQAIAQGCPTILTDAHGHKAFSHFGLPISATLTKADYFVFGPSGDWWEPSFDDLCDRMQWVYNNYEEAEERARLNALVVAKRFTWTHTANAFLDALGRDRLTPLSTPGPWFTPHEDLFRVVCRKDWKAQAAGVHYVFRKGVEYWEPAEIKRMLFEADLLDPSCTMGDETGLAPEQVEERGLYQARHEKCESCGQTLPQNIPLDAVAQ